MTSQKEKELVKALKNGNEEAFHQLYDIWCGKLYNFALRISNSDSCLSEEIVQDVFTHIWERRENLDENKQFGAYLCTITKNRLLNHYKHQMIQAIYNSIIKKRNETSNITNDSIDFQFLNEYIHGLINQLPPARRNVFILSREKSLSNKEIAQKLNISENTVEGHLSKALKFIREQIEKNYMSIITSLIANFFQ